MRLLGPLLGSGSNRAVVCSRATGQAKPARQKPPPAKKRGEMKAKKNNTEKRRETRLNKKGKSNKESTPRSQKLLQQAPAQRRHLRHGPIQKHRLPHPFFGPRGKNKGVETCFKDQERGGQVRDLATLHREVSKTWRKEARAKKVCTCLNHVSRADPT